MSNQYKILEQLAEMYDHIDEIKDALNEDHPLMWDIRELEKTVGTLERRVSDAEHIYKMPL